MRKTLFTLLIFLCLTLLFAKGQEDRDALPENFSDYVQWTKVNAETITGDATGAQGFREI